MQIVQLPVVKGIYSDPTGDYRTALPHNLAPVPKSQGISAGFLRPADGLVELATAAGFDRGGINWNGGHYRVRGTELVKIDAVGAISVVGDVGSGGWCQFDYSFSHLAVASGGRLYLYDGATFGQVTDTDLGQVLSVVWIDGYFLTTDGDSLIVTELNDPYTVDLLKYGSSERDPDPIMAVLEVAGEAYAVNRYTIEAFNNTGGTGFPFSRIDGAEVSRGAVGPNACCVFTDKIAFVGGGKREGHAVFVSLNGQMQKISSREIDTILAGYTDAQISGIVMEAREHLSHSWLYVHLPDQTLIYDAAASAAMQDLIWFTVSGGTNERTQYPAWGFVFVDGEWMAGNPSGNEVASIDRSISTQYGAKVAWEFGTPIVYLEDAGAIVHSLEIVGTTGADSITSDDVVETTYSDDGLTWSMPATADVGGRGERGKRIKWTRLGRMAQVRTQKFRGTAHITVARLSVGLEGLRW